VILSGGTYFATVFVMMKTTLLMLLTTLVLSACANTRQGISADAGDIGNKIQRTSEVWTSPN